MKFLNLDEVINIGGHRLSLNDLYQLQVANEQLGQVICQSFGTEAAGGRIIAGVVRTETGSPTPTHFSYTGGWMVKSNKLYKVNPIASTAIAGGFAVWFIFKTLNTYPPVTYQAGITHQIHQHHEVDIVYTATPPAGTINVDYTSTFLVIGKRISDIITEAAASTAYINALNQPWTQIEGAAIQSDLLYAGITAVLSASRFRYKIIGKTAYIQVSLILSAPSPTNFSIKFPTALQNIVDDTGVLTSVKQASILALDTRDTTLPCRVFFTPIITSPSAVPSLINFGRSHANTSQNAVSFMAIIELQ